MTAILQLLAKGFSAFYLGHSLVSTALPEMVSSALDAPVEYTLINGAPLEILWRDSASAQGVDGRTWLPSHPVDAIVLTERVALAPTMEYHATSDYATRWVELAWKANPEVRPYLYETWDEIDDAATGSTRAWRERIISDLALWQKIADDVNRNLPDLTHPVEIIPAGLGMIRLEDAAAAGRIPGASSIRDFFGDDIHPNNDGFYYVAMIHYAVLSGKSPLGLPNVLMGEYGPYPPVARERARVLQELAQETVTAWRSGDQRPRAQP